MTKLSIGLVHHPVVNKKGMVIGSSVTNLDLHDIARAARTYGVDRYYITTPYCDQRSLLEELMAHWQTGHGAEYNPARMEALSLVRVVDCLEAAIDELSSRYAQRPLVVTTSARGDGPTTSYQDLRGLIAEQRPVLLLFGTAHGLAPELMDTADTRLPPVGAGGDYNHLSVRSAAAIILDRLLGNRRGGGPATS